MTNTEALSILKESEKTVYSEGGDASIELDLIKYLISVLEDKKNIMFTNEKGEYENFSRQEIYVEFLKSKFKYNEDLIKRAVVLLGEMAENFMCMSIILSWDLNHFENVLFYLENHNKWRIDALINERRKNEMENTVRRGDKIQEKVPIFTQSYRGYCKMDGSC